MMEIEALLAIWWAWLALAGGLLIIELMAPGFIFLGIALGAAITAPVVWVAQPSLTATMMVFAVASVLAWVVLRRLFQPAPKSVQTFDTDIND